MDSIDLAKNRTKSAGVKRKSVRWKQIEYQDGTVRPFPADIETLRAERKNSGKITIQANLSNKPSILSYKKQQNSNNHLIQDAQMTGYAQQHIARKQFNRKQKNNNNSNRQIKYTKPDRNNNSIRPKSSDYLESRRTPTDNEITQLWQTVKHVIDENERQSTPHSVNPTQIRQLPQSYYLPRPPTANNPAFIYRKMKNWVEIFGFFMNFWYFFEFFCIHLDFAEEDKKQQKSA